MVRSILSPREGEQEGDKCAEGQRNGKEYHVVIQGCEGGSQRRLLGMHNYTVPHPFSPCLDWNMNPNWALTLEMREDVPSGFGPGTLDCATLIWGILGLQAAVLGR